MSVEPREQESAVGSPDVCRPIFAERENSLAAVIPRGIQDTVSVSLQLGLEVSVFDVPDPGCLVGAARDDSAAIRAPGGMEDAVFVPLQYKKRTAAGSVPDVCSREQAAGT